MTPTKKKKKSVTEHKHTFGLTPGNQSPAWGGKIGKENDELALHKCLTSPARGVQAHSKKNGEVKKYD